MLNFIYKAEELKYFLQSVDTFILALKSGKMVHYTPNNVASFRRWLFEHQIIDRALQYSHRDLFI
jgi:hypothetical protein